MGSRDDDPLLIAEREREIRIDTGEEALQRIEREIDERDVTTELDYLRAVRKVIQYGQADWFDAALANDEQPPDPDTVDEEVLEREVAQLERELVEERGETVDQDEFADELRDIEERLPDEMTAGLSDEELRELLVEVHEEKEAFRAAMKLDTTKFLQDDVDEEE